VSNRDNKAAAVKFRELVGVDFDEFTRQAPVKLLVALSKFAESVDITVLQFADDKHPLFQQQRERLVRALRYAWQRKEPDTATRRRQITEVIRRYWERTNEVVVGGEGDHKSTAALMPLGDTLN
jgi:hypothetical protein